VVLWESVCIAWLVCWGLLSLVIPMLWAVGGSAFRKFISLPACLGLGSFLAAFILLAAVVWARWSILHSAKRDSGVGVPERVPGSGWTVNSRRWRGALWLFGIVVLIAFGAALGPRLVRGTRSPGVVIAQRIQQEVGRQLREAGAAYNDLQVTIAVQRDSATPFKVTYRGLRHFNWGNGSAPAPDGEFIMQYIGGGKWQGSLGGMQFTVPVGRTDDFQLPFVEDPQVLGDWESVDFVAVPGDFDPERPRWRGKLYLEGLTFLEGGKTPKSWLTWTKGFLIHSGDKTSSRYEIREVKGGRYLFLEWKSGDVIIAGMKPHYYVLKKKP
jgi:hypothetical protein